MFLTSFKCCSHAFVDVDDESVFLTEDKEEEPETAAVVQRGGCGLLENKHICLINSNY